MGQAVGDGVGGGTTAAALNVQTRVALESSRVEWTEKKLFVPSVPHIAWITARPPLCDARRLRMSQTTRAAFTVINAPQVALEEKALRTCSRCAHARHGPNGQAEWVDFGPAGGSNSSKQAGPLRDGSAPQACPPVAAPAQGRTPSVASCPAEFDSSFTYYSIRLVPAKARHFSVVKVLATW